jgi:hypothetical protein
MLGLFGLVGHFQFRRQLTRFRYLRISAEISELGASREETGISSDKSIALVDCGWSLRARATASRNAPRTPGGDLHSHKEQRAPELARTITVVSTTAPVAGTISAVNWTTPGHKPDTG